MPLPDFAALIPRLAVAGDKMLVAGDWRGEARAALAEAGAVLLRGDIAADDGAERALSLLTGDLLEDAFWSTPRTRVSGKTLSATEFPSPRTIPLHSEMSYMRAWPRFIAFHALTVASEGGQTTICDVDLVSRELGEILPAFEQKGVRYLRCFQKGVDVPWQQAFQTERRKDVEKLGRRLDMTVEWLPNEALRTAHEAQGIVQAEDGAPLYFNQAHLFHASQLDPRLRESLEKLHGPGRLPRDATFGDGSTIPDGMIATVRTAFETRQTGMHWQPGDVLILDNMRYAHGRQPFSGARRLHVALARQQTRPVRTAAF